MESNMTKYGKMLIEFKELVSKIEYLKYTLNSLAYWDKITNMPEKGINYRGKVMSYLGGQLYEMLSDKKLKAYVEYFEGNKINDGKIDAMVKRIKRNNLYVNKIPEKEYRDYIVLIANAEQVWEKAKQNNDYKLFEPYLEMIINTFKAFAEYWGYEENPYDALMGYYEEGAKVKDIDIMALELRDFIIELLAQIKKNGKEIDDSFFCSKMSITKESQNALTKELLSAIGFDFSAGRVDEGIHPTTLASSPDDVRIITSYNSSDIRTGIFNTLHEGGKGLYEQDIDPELMGMLLAEVASFGVEEAEGRMYENIIGRSHGFWSFFYKKLQEIMPEMKNIELERFYKGINKVQPSLIRIDADELTYVMHIIIRYELEKDLISGKLAVSDLPAAWNQKYREYLGIEPETDGEGILQDIQWAAGYVGFFPSYFMANLMAAQFAATMEDELGPIEDLLEKGKLGDIHTWLAGHVHKYGASLTPAELVLKVSGKPLESKYYINYLRNKYFEVYDLKNK